MFLHFVSSSWLTAKMIHAIRIQQRRKRAAADDDHPALQEMTMISCNVLYGASVHLLFSSPNLTDAIAELRSRTDAAAQTAAGAMEKTVFFARDEEVDEEIVPVEVLGAFRIKETGEIVVCETTMRDAREVITHIEYTA